MLIVFRFLAARAGPGRRPHRAGELLRRQRPVRPARPVQRRRPATFSIVGLGVNPYINASIIMQLMHGRHPLAPGAQREGEYGRNKLNQYTRYLTVPMALLPGLWLPGHAGVAGRRHRPRSACRTARRSPRSSPCGGHDPAHVHRRAHHREGHRQRHQLHHLRRHRRPRPAGPRPRSCRRPGPRRRHRVFVLIGLVVVGVIVYIQEGQRRIPIQYASRVRGRRMYQGGVDVPAAAGQPGRRHPDHLRGQHPAVPDPDRVLLPDDHAGAGPLVRPISDGDRRLPGPHGCRT